MHIKEFVSNNLVMRNCLWWLKWKDKAILLWMHNSPYLIHMDNTYCGTRSVELHRNLFGHACCSLVKDLRNYLMTYLGWEDFEGKK